MAIGAEALGRRLGADRAGFLRIVDGDQIAFGIGWSDGSIPPLEGRAPLDVLGSDLRRGAIAGATLKFRDSRASARFADTTIPALGIISGVGVRSEEHTSELQSLMRISYAVFCLKKKK